MTLKNPFKLEKLKIEAYGKLDRSGPPEETLTVMFNPASFTMRHENKFQRLQGLNTSGRVARFTHGVADDLDLELVFDGTGVNDSGVLALLGQGTPSVAEQIEEFLNACFYMDGKIHEPKYLKILWGNGPLKDFECRLQSVQITYTSFDKSGAPLRATLATKFTECVAPENRARMDRNTSPDLSHCRVVREGDTLPLLCREIYGSPVHYVFVAKFNQLDDFRNLRPGQEIVFPPLVAGAPSSP